MRRLRSNSYAFTLEISNWNASKEPGIPHEWGERNALPLRRAGTASAALCTPTPSEGGSQCPTLSHCWPLLPDLPVFQRKSKIWISRWNCLILKQSLNFFQKAYGSKKTANSACEHLINGLYFFLKKIGMNFFYYNISLKGKNLNSNSSSVLL